MTKIVKSTVCMCTNVIFEYLPWGTMRCLKCGIQRVDGSVNGDIVIFEDDTIIDRAVIDKNIDNIEFFFKDLEKERKLQQQELIRQEEIKQKEREIKQKERERKEEIRHKELERIEKIKRQKFEAAKGIAIKEINKQYNVDYLRSKQVWASKFSKWVEEKEFNALSVRFVINWFEQQGWDKPDEEQAECIAEIWNDVQVIARAGSGKTKTIVNRTAFLVKHCRVSPSEILLLAFNREAAREVNERLDKMLGELAPQAMTFHALGYAIVHPEEELIFDDEMNGFKKSSTVQQVIDSFIQNEKWLEKIKEFMLKYFRSEWDEIVKGYQLSPSEMLKYRRSLPFLGVDGTHYKSMGEKRIADYLFEHDIPYTYEKNFWWNELNYKPDFWIPLNNKKMKGIVIEYFGMAGDREYDKLTRMKRNFWANKSDYYFIEVYPLALGDLDQFLKKNLQNCGISNLKLTDDEIWHRIKARAVGEFSLIVSQFIGRCRKLMISPQDLITKVQSQSEPLSELQIDFLRVVWKIFEEYLETLSFNNEEDFDGLLYRANYIIRSGQSRWKRKEGTGDLQELKYLFIDEYQDFSLLFYQLISAIKDNSRDLNLFCVGDDWQAINGFAGSDLRFFRNFKEYFKKSKQVSISSNYRSFQTIVNVGNKLMLGEGDPSKAVLNQPGEVWVAKMNKFIPNEIEKNLYNGDNVTPVLIRLIYNFIQQGQGVALLCRTGSGLPWYTSYDKRKGKFHADFITAIRNALPKRLRPMVVAMDTAHSYKGKEEEAVIVVDVVNRSFPLIHPRNVFFEVLGNTIEKVISEEKRLFYVALSRAKKSLVFLTEEENRSPFLNSILQNNKSNIKTMDINSLEPPKRDGTHCIVKVANNYSSNDTIKIKSYLIENKYKWNPAEKAWTKTFAAKGFTKERIINESWVKYASNVNISVSDEFGNKILNISLRDRKIQQ
jgi:DNA helicase-4